MTNKEIEEMAGHRQVPPWVMMLVQNCIEKEREACARIADSELDNCTMLTGIPQKSSAAWNIAAAIRARGEVNGIMD